MMDSSGPENTGGLYVLWKSAMFNIEHDQIKMKWIIPEV